MAFQVVDFSGYWEGFSHNLNGPQPSLFGTLDSLFCRFFTDLDPDGRLPEVKMFGASVAGIRAAKLLSLGGASMPVPTVLRNSLESAAYGALFGAKPEWHSIWSDRHENKKHMKKFRDEGLAEARASLDFLGEGFSQNFRSLYQMLIDIGAHPNTLGIDPFTHAQSVDENAEIFSFQQLSDHHERQVSFVVIGQIGLFVCNVIASSWPDKLKDRRTAEQALLMLKQIESLEKEIEAGLSGD